MGGSGLVMHVELGGARVYQLRRDHMRTALSVPADAICGIVGFHLSSVSSYTLVLLDSLTPR